MSAQELITEHLDLWTGAVTKKSNSGRGSNGKVELTGVKKLRELILGMAVYGKLTTREARDEPASNLLQRISARQTQLYTQGKIKKRKKLPRVSVEEQYFHLPENWEWTRLGTLFDSIMSGGTPSKQNPRFWGGDIPWASVKDLGKIKHLDKTQDYITEEGLKAGSKLADTGDVLICTRMGLGKVAICSKPIAINQDLKAVKVSSEVSLDYFFLAYTTLDITGTGTTVAGITQDKLLNYVIGLPPIGEQHRIVQKVDELMAVCDRLEQQTSDQLEALETLVDTLLGTLTQSENATELADNWARLAAHFDTLFTTEQSIDKLKQTVIELSVRGFLISTNDEGGEPTEILLNRLRNEKQRLIATKKAKDNGKIHQKAPKEPPYDIPSSWTWVRFRELIWCYRGHNPPKSEFKTEPQPGYVRFIQITDFKTDANKVFVPQTSRNKMVHKGEIIMAAYRHIGKLSRNMEGAFNVALCKILEFEPMERDFVELLIRTDLVTGELLRASERGHIPSMHSDHLLSLLVPLPPLVQQRKIVKRVAELATICDQLKERLNQAGETRCQLAEAVVEEALN